MKKFILAMSIALASMSASALEYQLTPTTEVPAKVAKRSAATLGRYVISAEGLAQGVKGYVGFDEAALGRVIRGGMTICYGPNTALSYSVEKPVAPYVCVEDLTSLSNTTRTYSTAKKYNNKLNPPLTEVTFKAKLAEIVAQ